MTHKHPAPILVAKNGFGRVVRQLSHTCSLFPEKWLQELLRNHPELLPVNHLRSDVGTLTCIGREVRTAVGIIDNLYLSSGGYPVIVETKLWRNPQARREALSQILEYIMEVATRDFFWFEEQYKRSTNGASSLIEHMAAVAESDEFDEATFIDRVERALRAGDILGMIVGDGIQTRMQKLVDHLCRDSVQLRYSLALVELACYVQDEAQTRNESNEKLEGDLIVVPRIISEVQPVERAHVRVEIARELEGAIKVMPVIKPEERTGPRPTLSEDEFFAVVQAARGDQLAQDLREFYKRLAQPPIEADVKGRIMLKLPDPADEARALSLFAIVKDGSLYNPEHIRMQLQAWGASSERMRAIVTEYWGKLNAIDARFSFGGSNHLHHNYVDFADVRNKTSAIHDAIQWVVEEAMQLRTEESAL